MLSAGPAARLISEARQMARSPEVPPTATRRAPYKRAHASASTHQLAAEAPVPALALQDTRSGYLEFMARPRLPDSARVPIGLKVSEADAAGIDKVLARPEFAGWTRSEWCREIIRTALRYYVGDAPVPDPRQARALELPAASQAVNTSQPLAATAASLPIPAADVSSPAVPPGASEPVPPAHKPPAQPECLHPADARDYETGTCAACGAVLWD